MTGPAQVLWVIKGLGPGGAERLVVDIVPRLDRDRFAPEVAYLLPWKDHLVPELRAAGIPVHCLEVRRHADPRWMARLRHLAEGRVDLIHAHLPFAGIGTRWAVRRMRPPRPPLVYTEHNLWDRYRGLTAWANARTFGWNDRVIAVSGAVAEGMRRGDRRPPAPPVTVVENGVDAPAIRAAALSREEARRALGLDAGALVIGTIGGITPKKGHRFLVQAMRSVVDRHPNAILAIVGLGADEEPVRAEIVRLGLGNEVRLLGYVEHAARVLPAFDVFCLPSLFEGSPVSLLEALALGVPVVATAVGGVPAVLATGGGVTVPPADPGALAGALLALLDDPSRRGELANEGPEVAGRYPLERTVRAIESVYDELLATRPPRT